MFHRVDWWGRNKFLSNSLNNTKTELLLEFRDGHHVPRSVLTDTQPQWDAVVAQSSHRATNCSRKREAINIASHKNMSVKFRDCPVRIFFAFAAAAAAAANKFDSAGSILSSIIAFHAPCARCRSIKLTLKLLTVERFLLFCEGCTNAVPAPAPRSPWKCCEAGCLEIGKFSAAAMTCGMSRGTRQHNEHQLTSLKQNNVERNAANAPVFSLVLATRNSSAPQPLEVNSTGIATIGLLCRKSLREWNPPRNTCHFPLACSDRFG